MQSKKRLLVLGITLRTYPRNRILLDALSREFVLDEVKLPEGISGQFELARTFFSRIRNVDGVFFIQPTTKFAPILFILRFLTKKILIGDPFISIYDTLVSDRALARGKSLKGLYYRLLDVLYVHAFDALFFDTPEHEAYFIQTCWIPRRTKRFIVPICVDVMEIDGFQPRWPKEIFESKKMTVLYHGGYIPLQGIQYIIDAASLFRNRDDVRFIFVGSGQLKKVMVERARELGLDNVQFVNWLEFPEIISAIKMADVSLGIFGDTEKAQRVIPNKILESMAVGTPVVCGRNVPIERHFVDNEHIFYARLADPADIARAIDLTLSDAVNRKRIAISAKEKIRENFSLDSLVSNEIHKFHQWFSGVESLPMMTNESVSNQHIAVYTAIFGSKDHLREPLVQPPNCDFICFTDQPLRSNVWQIRHIEPPVSGDMTRSNRHVKFFPNLYLADYEYSIYIDGNMRLLADPRPLVDMYLRDTNIAFFDHMGNVGDARDSIYMEADALIGMAERGKHKEDPGIIRKQIGSYRNEGYPKNAGLITGMVILRRHFAGDVVSGMEAWWNELSSWSRRDQLSFNYVAWKQKMNYSIIPGDSRNNPFFYRHGHGRSGIRNRFRASINELLFIVGFY